MAKKLIRPDKRLGREDEVFFTVSDKINNTELLLEFVRLHMELKSCENCNWTFAVVGYDKIELLHDFQKPCLVMLHVELLLVQQLINILLNQKGFKENVDYKPKLLNFMGMLMIYCEPKQ